MRETNIMKNDFDKIVRTVCKVGDMEIKHITSHKTFNKTTGKYEDVLKSIKNNSSKAGINGLSSVYMGSTFDKIILESAKEMEKTKDGKYIPKNSVSFGYGDYTNLKIALDYVSKWFTEEKYRNGLFQYTKDGKPYGLSTRYKNMNIKFKSRGGYLNNNTLQMEPAVISTFMNTDTYPGVLLRGSTGIIGRCSVTEFYILKDILLDLIRNLYQNSLMLTILGEITNSNI